MASFLNTKNLTLNQDLYVKLNGDAPIVIGTLKISLQLGCGQLYFGREFIDAIYSNKENIKYNSDSENNIAQLDTKHENSEASVLSKDVTFSDKHYEIINRKNISGGRSNKENISGKQHTIDASPVKENIEDRNPPQKQMASSRDRSPNLRKNLFSEIKIDDSDKQVLFGFIYVGDAQFSTARENTFVTCQPFCQDDVFYSRLVHRNSNPHYAFSQVLPFVYDDNFLNKLRDNYMIFEFWETLNNQDILIGISKISLHQFYVAFRNPVITKYLNRNRLPVICCDGWEPICNPLSGEIYGQAQILISLGADVQVHNLRLERGFETESVIAKSARSDISKQLTDNDSIINKQQVRDTNTSVEHPNTNRSGEIINNSSKIDPKNFIDKKKVSTKKKFTHQKSPSNKVNSKNNFVDVAIQSDMGDSQDNMKSNLTQTSDVLGALLAQLLQQRQKQYVENSTNTENKQIISTPQSNVIIPESNTNVDNNMKIRRTSDLLDSLQQALTINQPPQVSTNRTFRRTNDMFRAHIVVENALHLPSRTKCTAKMTKGKSRFEEILPSAYVSFETVSEFKVTNVVEERKNPEWDYNCDVELPADLLTNNQKRMIFKVWKKAANYTPLEPNFESDTVLGFAALDLTVLLAGMPTVSGWFNIIDFSNKCNGQIKISVTPLENLQRFVQHRSPFASVQSNAAPSIGRNYIPPEIQTERTEEPGELLSRALKRKFTELDEITQRLKLRLSHVTNDESDTSNDEFADEFEKDINTLCVEEDYDMINFEEDGTPHSETQEASGALLQIQNSNFIYKNENRNLLTRSINTDGCTSRNRNENETKGIESDDNSNLNLNIDTGLSNVAVVSQLDKQLIAGRQKIDSLLEKLSLLNHNEAEIFDNRYVSGCSTKHDSSKPISDDILKDIRKDIDPISTDISTDNSTANIHTAYTNKKPFNISNSSTSSNSGLLTEYTEYRLAPDGAGNASDDINKTVNVPGGTISNT